MPNKTQICKQINEYKNAIQNEPKGEYFYLLANLHFLMKEYNLAEIEYKKAIEHEYRYPEAHNNLGCIYFYTKYFENAIRSVQIGFEQKDEIKQKKESIKIIKNFGYVQYIMQNFIEAKKYLHLALEIIEEKDKIQQQSKFRFEKVILSDVGLSKDKRIEEDFIIDLISDAKLDMKTLLEEVNE